MNHRLPTDVPTSGERFNLTLTGSGLDKRKRELAHFVIDGEKSRGVRVSLFLTPQVKAEFMELFDMESDDLSATALDARKYDFRFSAEIAVTRLAKNSHGMFTEVDEKYDRTNVYCSYDLSEFRQADGASTLVKALKQSEKKFTRKPAAKKKAPATKAE